MKVMGPGVIIQGSWDVAQGLDFPDPATDTNKNLFEKGSAGQIHEDFQVMQRIKGKRAGSVWEKCVPHLECTAGFLLFWFLYFHYVSGMVLNVLYALSFNHCNNSLR